MRTALLVIGLLLLALAGYAYKTNPAACAKLGTDVSTDLIAVFKPSGSDSASVSQTADNTTASSPLPQPPAAPPPPLPPLNLKPGVVATSWNAPLVNPAQPNWTWTTIDGTTYQNVVVTKIAPDVVSITHSLGVAHLPMANLPADLQKQLNYDPAAASAMRGENQREQDHPYYLLASLADAQAAARQLHWPLAWMCTDLSELNYPNPRTNTTAELTQMSLNYLKSRAVVVFVNGNDDLGKLSWPVVREQQFFKYDDGAVPGGHHFMGPKIVFTDPDITRPLGRATYSEMFYSREAAIEAVLSAIASNTPAPAPVAPATPPQL